MKNRKIILLALSLMMNFSFAQRKKIKEKEIKGVVIRKKKKAVEHKPDRTIFNFSEQPHLNTGTAMEGIKKLPGLIVSDIAGMMYQGKILDVYMDSRPLNITSNELNSFLEGIPASAIEKIEVITQPGAEYPATSGGAILNIITNKNAKKYLTATYSGGYRFSHYDKLRQRTNHSLNINAKNKYFAWQLNVGQNYAESNSFNNMADIFSTDTEQQRRGYFAKGAMTFNLGKDRMILNYDLFHRNNDNTVVSEALQYFVKDHSKNKNLRQNASLTYQKKFYDKDKKLNFKASYTDSKRDFTQNGLTQSTQYQNASHFQNGEFKIDYTQPIQLLDEGKLNFGGLYEKTFFEAKNEGITNLDYSRQTASSYLELQTKWKKLDFILGARLENYDIFGTTLAEGIEENLTPFKKTKLFPNASVQYNFIDKVYFGLNYNKKIRLPSISALNPNNNTYQNPNASITGNPNLQPTIFDNYEAKLSVFDYAFISYNISRAKNQVANVIYTKSDNTFANEQININDMKIHNVNIGLPLPFMLFTKPLSEVMKVNFNPDKINFMYLYAGYQKHQLPDIQTKGFWVFNLMTQLILPKEIKLVGNYSHITKNGSYYYYNIIEPFNQSFDLTLSRKFLNKRLNVSLYANDIFNQRRVALSSNYQTPIYFDAKRDTRSFGISLSYKIRAKKNKLATEERNLLNSSNTEEDTSILK
ncbi:MAG: TonB-dependent receptor [Flavobacteriales bacterium]|nr:MAG: TonB-dependent receptor [Flavobacteriales bacterium]